MFTAIYVYCFFSGKWDYSLIISGNQYAAWTNIFILLPVLCEIILLIRVRYKSKLNNVQKTPLLEIEKVYNIEDTFQLHHKINNMKIAASQEFVVLRHSNVCLYAGKS